MKQWTLEINDVQHQACHLTTFQLNLIVVLIA